jgi:chromosomal replication initiation ATPase DnaA
MAADSNEAALMSAQLVLPLEPNNAMTRADFIVAPGNARALAFLDSFPDWPVSAAALHGPSASGKTHLARIWAARCGAELLDARDLREAVKGSAVIENLDSTLTFAHEPALFAMLEGGAPLLLTGRAVPALWPVSLPDLGSRFRSLLAFEVGASDEALLTALAVKLFADRQLTVPESVVTHLVQTLERSPAALRDFISRADARALAEKKPVNLQLIRVLMAE